MQDVCWIHGQKFRVGDACPDCLKRDQKIKQSIEDEVEESVVKQEPGDRLWGVVKTLVLVNVVLWILMVLGAIAMSR